MAEQVAGTAIRTVLLEGILKRVQSAYKETEAGAHVVTTVVFECDGLVAEDIARLFRMQRSHVVAEVGRTQGELDFPEQA